jgi:predicted XRE-type DNA-binding protein
MPPNASAKLRLAYALNQVLDERKLSQAEAGQGAGLTQPKVSALRNYKLAGFSVERLMNLLTALDQDVEIVIRRKPRSRKWPDQRRRSLRRTRWF